MQNSLCLTDGVTVLKCVLSLFSLLQGHAQCAGTAHHTTILPVRALEVVPEHPGRVEGQHHLLGSGRDHAVQEGRTGREDQVRGV